MSKKLIPVFAILLVVCCWVVACSSGDVSHDPEVSGCGGFDEGFASKFKASKTDKDCDTWLDWDYDVDSQTLFIADTNVELNCCGDHSIVVSESDDGGYLIREIDKPEGGVARCDCYCNFDFRTAIHDVTQGVIHIEVKREITDSGETEVEDVCVGNIDISEI